MIPHSLFKTPQTEADECRFVVSPAKRLLMLASAMVFCWVISNVINGFLINHFGSTTRILRVAAIIQSLIQIILPSLITALIICRYPARLLEIDHSPNVRILFLAGCVLILSVPAMNLVIDLNASIHLPESLSSLENWIRKSEDNAALTISQLQGNGKISDLILNVLIIGIMAGLGEELLFRGTIQRILATSGINIHLSIWATAALFSAMHFQFFGFVPRLFLGAFFGYLLYWTGSLWVPIIIHALNNIIYVVIQWNTVRMGLDHNTAETIGNNGGWVMILISVALTTAAIFAIYSGRIARRPLLK